MKERAGFWIYCALIAYPIVRILIHLLNVALGLAGSATSSTLASHYVIAVIINALPALTLRREAFGRKAFGRKAFGRNVLQYCGLILVILLVVDFFPVVQSLGTDRLTSALRRALIDIVNYTLAGVSVAFFAAKMPTRWTQDT